MGLARDMKSTALSEKLGGRPEPTDDDGKVNAVYKASKSRDSQMPSHEHFKKSDE